MLGASGITLQINVMKQFKSPTPVRIFQSDQLKAAVYEDRSVMGFAAAIHVVDYLQEQLSLQDIVL